jgi:hypothetical protein
MSWNPSDSAINVTPDLEKMLATASPEEMKVLFRDAAVNQGLAVHDVLNANILHETELSRNAPKRFAKTLTVTVDGVQHKQVIEGTTPEELLESEIQFFRDLQEPTQQEQPRDAQGRFSTQPTVDDAAIEQYLTARGINPEALRETSDSRYIADWQTASEQFMARHHEWAGGAANRTALGETILALGLEDTPSVAALETAYAELQRQHRYVTNTPEVTAARAENEIGAANTVEEIRELGRRSMGIPTASGVFGGR